jgi:hypothetical protein
MRKSSRSPQQQQVLFPILVFALVATLLEALVLTDVPRGIFSRQAFVQSVATTAIIATAGASASPRAVHAEVSSNGNQRRLSDEELKKIVKADILDRQFLVTGKLTRSIYQPTATFTDEIDTYAMEKWIVGTQRLFVGEGSDVRLIGDVQVTPEKVEFRFDEDLMFRIPFRPTVALSGKVILSRDESGLVTSYQEFWDQDVATVLKSAKFKF